MKKGKLSRAIIERFLKGDDILQGLNEFARRNQITAASLVGLGSVQRATVGFFIGDGKYSTVSLDGPLEVLSCVGNISVKNDSPFVHAHLTLADKSGRAYGGHLMEGCIVDATFEVSILVHGGMKLTRDLDPTTGLYLLQA